MSAESAGTAWFTHVRLRFRAWRGTRPFWAGLFTLLGGVPISYLPYADLRLGNITIAMATTAGAGSLIIGVLLITLGLTMWFHSIVRVFAGVASIVLALISIPVANFGGLAAGYLLALVGGAMSVSWAPGTSAVAAEPVPGGPEPADAGPAERVPGQRAREAGGPNATGSAAGVDGGRNRAG
jgi:hypothetical protein